MSILRRLLNVVDHQEFDRPPGGLEFQPKLLLQRAENRRSGRITRNHRCRWINLPQLAAGHGSYRQVGAGHQEMDIDILYLIPVLSITSRSSRIASWVEKPAIVAPYMSGNAPSGAGHLASTCMSEGLSGRWLWQRVIGIHGNAT